MDLTPKSQVEFALNSLELDKQANGGSTKFVDGGRERRTQYIHRVKLEKLKPNSTYCE